MNLRLCSPLLIEISVFNHRYPNSEGMISQMPHPRSHWPGLCHMSKPEQVPGEECVPTTTDVGQARFTCAPGTKEGHVAAQ